MTYLPADVYYVQVQSCDGKAFSEIFQSTMEIGYFSVQVTAWTKVTVTSGNSTSMPLNITNKGAMQDTLTITLQGSAMANKNLTIVLGTYQVTLEPDQGTVVQLNVSAAAGAPSRTYDLTLIVTSKDGSTKDSFDTSVVVLGSGPDDDVQTDDDTDDDVTDDDTGDDDSVDPQVYQYGFYIFVIIIVIIVAVVTYVIRMWYLKKQDTEEPVNKPVDDHKYQDEKVDLDGKMDDEFDEVDITEDEPSPPPKGRRK